MIDHSSTQPIDFEQLAAILHGSWTASLFLFLPKSRQLTLMCKSNDTSIWTDPCRGDSHRLQVSTALNLGECLCTLMFIQRRSDTNPPPPFVSFIFSLEQTILYYSTRISFTMTLPHLSHRRQRGISNLMIGACVGPVILMLGLCLLFWNEGNIVTKHRTLDQGLRNTIEAETSVDPANEGSLVHVTGNAVAVEQSARDAVLGVSPSRALRLARHVEMYQWIEQDEGSAFTYIQDWGAIVERSSDFAVPVGHENPVEILFSSEQFVAANIQLGPYTLRNENTIVQKFTWFQDMTEEAVNVENIPDEQVRSRMHPYGMGLYYGDDPSSPQIGDFRITYQVVVPQTVSIIAVQTGNTLQPFQNGHQSILLFERGSFSMEEMYDHANTVTVVHAWMIRAAGIMVVFIALLIMPLRATVDCMPLVFGDVIGSASASTLLPVALVITLFVIAVSWMTYQPALGLVLLGVVGGFIANRIQEARLKPLTEGYVVGNGNDDHDIELHSVVKD